MTIVFTFVMSEVNRDTRTVEVLDAHRRNGRLILQLNDIQMTHLNRAAARSSRGCTHANQSVRLERETALCTIAALCCARHALLSAGSQSERFAAGTLLRERLLLGLTVVQRVVVNFCKFVEKSIFLSSERCRNKISSSLSFVGTCSVIRDDLDDFPST